MRFGHGGGTSEVYQARHVVSELPAAYTGIKGFLVPVFTDEMTGMNGLARADFDKVRLGYACADCLAEFSTYRTVCPICGLERDVAKDIAAPREDWDAHLRERERTDAPATRARTPDEAIRALLGDRDVEHIPLSKLKPRRRA